MFWLRRLRQYLLLLVLIGLGCTTPRPVKDVWRPGPGDKADHIPGPMKGFGPFDSFADALKAACPLILSKPNATVGHLKDANRQLAFRTSTEYCAWLYYTPDHRYEMSMLTDQSAPDDLLTGRRSCILPAFVDDSRYAPSGLKYIFALHNHPFGGLPSPGDLRFSDEMAELHAWAIETKNNKVLLSIIAFFSKSTDPEQPTCDGFYQYVPATLEMLKWTHSQGVWEREELGTVNWLNGKNYRLDKKR